MATVTRTGNFVNISAIAADVSMQDIFQTANDVKVKRMEFIVGSANDVIVIKNGSDSSAEICRLGSASAAEADRIYFQGGQLMKPFIDFSACTLNAGHKLIIELG